MDIVQILNQFLAPIIDKFKASSPTVAAALAFVLMVLFMNADSILLALGVKNETVASTAKIVLFAIATLLGSRTQQFLNKDQETGL